MDYSSYAKKLSEGLYQQAKGLGLGVDSPASQGKTRVQGSSNTPAPPPPASLASRLQPLVLDGHVLYNPGGPFQEFLLRVEDAVLFHLISSCESASSAAPLLREAAKVFLTVAAPGDSFAYAGSSPVATIRLAIRSMS